MIPKEGVESPLVFLTLLQSNSGSDVIPKEGVESLALATAYYLFIEGNVIPKEGVESSDFIALYGLVPALL